MIKVLNNEDKNGIEIYFSEKPKAETIEALKSYFFRWHRAKKCWYAKKTAERENFIKSLGVCSVGAVAKKEENKKAFIWKYGDELDGAKIYKNANDAGTGKQPDLWNEKNFYLYDEKLKILVNYKQIIIIELQNALKPGLTCLRTSYDFWSKSDNNAIIYLCNTLKIGTLAELLEAHKNNTLKEHADNTYISEEKSSRNFSPFAKLNRIKKQKK